VTKPTDATSPERKGIRLQAYLASCGVASRRACEAIILEGRVSIDGTIVKEMGVRVREQSRVELDGRLVEPESRKIYLVLNKPAGVLSTLSDPHGRPVAADILKNLIKERVYNIGRLDYDSSGLLLFTKDGEFASQVGHPSGGIEKEYLVLTDKDIPEEFVKAFLRGIPDEGQILRALRVHLEDARNLRVVLVEGRNREIRRALSVFGLSVHKLTRVRIGPVSIEGLSVASFRDLTENERQELLAHAKTRNEKVFKPNSSLSHND